jgi:molybdopterin/thiamine biosynthesis adenylyltransferase
MESQELQTLLSQTHVADESSVPQLFELSKAGDQRQLLDLFARKCVRRVVDDYEEQLREHYAVCNPSRALLPSFADEFRLYREKAERDMPLWQQGRWAYFPWSDSVVHILEEEAFFRVRTARNHNIITPEEQRRFYDGVVGIAGLSVGSNIALAVVLEGGGKHIRIADHDRLALSNTNRVITSLDRLGLLKTDITARQIYSSNPYARVETYSEGISQGNIAQFFDGPPRLDVVIDEIDNLAVKYLIRQEAQRRKIPVVMGTDMGESALIDIERYDLNPTLPLFHNRLGRVTYDGLAALNKKQTGLLIGRYTGAGNVPLNVLTSFLEIGRTLVAWPQLGGAAMLNGAAISLCVRRILTGQGLQNNRAVLKLERNLVPGGGMPYWMGILKAAPRLIARELRRRTPGSAAHP